MSQFTVPVKRLRTPADLAKFSTSQVHSDLVSFVTELANSVHGVTLDDESVAETHWSLAIKNLATVLDEIDSIIERHPVVADTTSRFGKLEFRDFYDDLSKTIHEALSSNLKFKDPNVSSGDPYVELSTYILNSFGDRTRIDYGSGHELNFLCFLLCLQKLHYFEPKIDDKFEVLVIFNKYLKLMRKLQLKYWLEPAGSHGVWGLDDYHFLPFLFGAAQLSPELRPRPLTIHQPDYVEMFKDKYFYFGCIDFINQVKTGATSLRWHSPMLDDISGVKTWKKIEEGMFKMFNAEVLNKLPIVQHFMFGSILPCPEGVGNSTDNDITDHDHESCGHDHSSVQNTWGDCCGIKVPSAIGAAMQQRNQHHIPFD